MRVSRCMMRTINDEGRQLIRKGTRTGDSEMVELNEVIIEDDTRCNSLKRGMNELFPADLQIEVEISQVVL